MFCVSVLSPYSSKVESIDCRPGNTVHPTRAIAARHSVGAKRVNGQNKLRRHHNELLEGEARSAASCMTAMGCVQEVGAVLWVVTGKQLRVFI